MQQETYDSGPNQALTRYEPSAGGVPTRQDMHAVTAAWEALMAGEERGLEHVRPSIRASWARSQRLGVNPYLPRVPVVLSAAELEAEQERSCLLAVAQPLIESAVTMLRDDPWMLTISDRSGHILHTNGHPRILEWAGELNAVPGGSMAEEHIGTGAANAVLASGGAEYVLWSEHYCQVLHDWACLGVPVRYPSTRELMGVLVAGGDELTPLLTVKILGRLAARLEQLLAHEELVRRVALLDTHQRFLLDHPQDAVLALDGRGQVWGVSPAVAQFLPAPQHLFAHSLLRVPGLQVEGLRACTQPPDGRPYEIAVHTQERGLTLRATALPVNSEQHVVGSLVVLRPPTAARPQRGTSTPQWRARYTFADLRGAAPAFQHSVTLARRAAETTFPVLLLGESGTGKEVLAQAIHTASPRGQGPFVAVNCGAGSDELLSAELFGYAAGAFTGAVKGGRKGKVELAHGGTLFLDEVEAMSAKMQVSLLRVLEEGRVTPVGAEAPVGVDVRVIAAANEDVQEAVGQKRFRLDLYHRLAVFPILLPPLRERTEDLPVLIRHLLDDLGFSHVQPMAEVVTLLCRYAWPGNVRELKNVLLRAAHLAPGTAITPAELPQEISSVVAQPASPPHGSLRDTEHEMIVRVLADTQGNLTMAAARLGIHRATLYRKVKKFGLRRVG